ncbi:class I SAM-dependent methyltransferase [Paraburkholderia sp. CNPSo 3272]|uniref:class I SAM-dependent methyltransferase n=1 Tax=Paraburkholderia sp. CNPSo 3272 TaxID=2940931 RepID=UPI0020B8855A|nr:methyltransferase domain-containing protein [Paraburkholderia sp. CNPSo 3272]MCP3726164.1 class I SAM-dependent methyltransferase [Paraburkholderia sp. CNPSo 3272]
MTVGTVWDPNSAELCLRDLRHIVQEVSPQLLGIFEEYAAEARFGRGLIEDDLAGLPRGARVLEVGAGSLMLSCILVRDGYAVTALEPVGSGFSHFTELQSIVVSYASQQGIMPTLLQVSGEDLEIQDHFDYAFSINVMEHVRDVALVLEKVRASLKPGTVYRFVCPNYAFPYEPHFNIPTLLSRSLTEKVMSRWIFESKNVVDPNGTWASLNWISVGQVRRICRQQLQTEVEFNRATFKTFLGRTLSDRLFQARRGPLLRWVITALDRTGLLAAAALIPVAVQPIMDCRVLRA